MSRFDQLDLDDDKPRRRPASPSPNPAQAAPTGTPIRDAAWFRAEADAQFRLGNLEDALRAYSRALEQNNAYYEGWLGQVRVLLENGELNEAVLWSDKALEMFPNQPELLAAKALASLRMGKKQLALAQSDNAMSRPGVTAFVWLARAEILMAARRRMADSCLDKAIELCAANADARAWTYWEIARLARRHGNVARALESARQAAGILPRESAVWLELARCQIAFGQVARPALQQAVALSRECHVGEKLLRDYREPGRLSRLLFFWRKG